MNTLRTYLSETRWQYYLTHWHATFENNILLMIMIFYDEAWIALTWVPEIIASKTNEIRGLGKESIWWQSWDPLSYLPNRNFKNRLRAFFILSTSFSWWKSWMGSPILSESVQMLLVGVCMTGNITLLTNNKGPLWTGRICFQRSKFFHFIADSFSEQAPFTRPNKKS